jgi:hypothetical protein
MTHKESSNSNDSRWDDLVGFRAAEGRAQATDLSWKGARLPVVVDACPINMLGFESTSVLQDPAIHFSHPAVQAGG